jgi:hypothetical protein
MVLVDQPTEDRAPLGLLRPRSPWTLDRALEIVRAAKIEGAVGPVRVVVRGILTQDARQVSSADDQEVIEHLSSQTSDQSLDVSVGLWAPVGG